MERKKLKVAIAGLGHRGKDIYAYGSKRFPDLIEIVAVADTNPDRVKLVAGEFGIPEEFCFSSAEEMIAHDKLADAMFICTQDRQHVGQAIPALEKGYDLLLEKPISPDLEECRRIIQVAQQCGRKVLVSHVLRYTVFYQELKKILDEKRIGEIISVQASENVGYWHQAHSFVRGNWKDSEITSPMILQKCCHDMDILTWLTGKKCRRVTSFGSTSYFKEEKAKEGTPKRCTDGCPYQAECPYDAEKIYLPGREHGVPLAITEWFDKVLTLEPTEENIRKQLETGPYGCCVFHSGNNVVDHQVVNLVMTDETTIDFTMCGFTHENARYTRIMGTMGEIEANMESNLIKIYRFGYEPEVVDVTKLTSDFSGHGGGDVLMLKEFIHYALGDQVRTNTITTLEQSMESHFIAWAAEISRLKDGEPVNLDDIRKGAADTI